MNIKEIKGYVRLAGLCVGVMLMGLSGVVFVKLNKLGIKV
jgi:hypothetical protein